MLQGHVRPCLSLLTSLWFTDFRIIGQIAIDSAIFPEGTNGAQLDVLARKALWQDGLNYMVNLFWQDHSS